MSLSICQPTPVIVIDCSDNRTRLALLIGFLLLVATFPRWIGPVADIFFGKLLGL